ncbi:MAG: AAA family ATPase [Deltaproteobacteria bacterium]|nr:AAA family ATPase [Deltaproteobacteria bacterium]
MTSLPEAPELQQILGEAHDISASTQQQLGTVHVLLAFFTTRNQAGRLLRNRGIDEDRLLRALDPGAREPRGTIDEVFERASQIAAGCGAREVDCLHVLVAMTRARDALAYKLLDQMTERMSALRTRALTILTGAVPRWLDDRRRSSAHEEEYVAVPSAIPHRRPRERGLHEARAQALVWNPPIRPPSPKSTRREYPTRSFESDERSSRMGRGRPQPNGQASERLRNHQSEENKPNAMNKVRNAGAIAPGPGAATGTAPKAALGAGPSAGPGATPGATPGTAFGAATGTTPKATLGAGPGAAPGTARDTFGPAAARQPGPSADGVLNPSAGEVLHTTGQRSPDIHANGEPRSQVPASTSSDPAAPWLLPPAKYPWLTSLGRNLSAEAARGKLDRLVGRQREIEQLIDILGKRRGNNPCLLGEPGVGKTAVVEGLAAHFVQSYTGNRAETSIIVGLDVGALLVGTHLRGSFSEKLQGLRDEVKRSRGRVIIFFDELHTLVGAGAAGDGPQDAANELKSALARGDFPCIGASTHEEYALHIERDAALKRRFVPVLVREPSEEEAIAMIRQIIVAYAKHHEVHFTDESIEHAVRLSSRYLKDRFLPDKAIALLDLAGSRVARSGHTAVTPTTIAELVAERVDLPVERILASDRDRLLNLERLLAREIVGHRDQISRIAEAIRRSAAGFRTRRPQAAFLFVGPTGVGKTETARALASVLHGQAESMIRFDLSEFSESHTVSRLIGSPPGYVGHDSGGQLTEAVRQRPGRVILFDEIEKAHPSVLQVLLQVLDEGRLTDGRGRSVSFEETIIIMTSNAGADLAKMKPRIGFDGPDDAEEDLDRQVLENAKRHLSPELWGRIQERLVFRPLKTEEIRAIARLLAADSSRRLFTERGIQYQLDEHAVDFLLEQGGFDINLGARPMRHVLARIVEAPIAARILEGRLHADETVWITTRRNGGLAFLVGEDRTSLSQRPSS